MSLLGSRWAQSVSHTHPGGREGEIEKESGVSGCVHAGWLKAKETWREHLSTTHVGAFVNVLEIFMRLRYAPNAVLMQGNPLSVSQSRGFDQVLKDSIGVQPRTILYR